MNIEGGQCTWDFMSVTFDDGTGTGVICGNNIPPPGTFIGPGPCTVQFTSDNGVTLRGFQLEYEITPDDLCIGNQCENDSECIQDDTDPRGYICNCPPGLTGDFCEADINECAEGLCENGICENFFAGFNCECEPFFTGDSCNLELDACFTREAPCNLTGTDFCESLDPFLFQPAFLCNCKAGFFSDDCRVSVCDTENPCLNGNCFVGNQGDAKCRCHSNETGTWIGQTCDVFEVSSNPGMQTFLTTLIIAAGSIALYFILSYCYKRGQVILKHHSRGDQPDTVNPLHDQYHNGPRDRSLPRFKTMALAQAAARRAKHDLPDRKQRVFHQRPSSITSGYVTEEFYSDRHRNSISDSSAAYGKNRNRGMNDSYRSRNTRIPEVNGSRETDYYQRQMMSPPKSYYHSVGRGLDNSRQGAFAN